MAENQGNSINTINLVTTFGAGRYVEWATTMKKTPKEIVDMLKIKYGQDTFSEVSAKNLVDMILKQAKITPHNTPGATARAAGQTMNQQIRAARAAQAAKGS